MSSKSPKKVTKASNSLKKGPDFSIEKSIGGRVCGLDEVGRAPVAGAVVAACVFIPEEHKRKKIWRKVNDSKMLTRQFRDEIVAEIREYSFWAIGEACPREIENINVVQASFLAMKRAFEQMCVSFEISPDAALIDGHIKPQLPCGMRAVVKGDSKSVSIAAASIIAKVHRDNILTELAKTHPHYGWERNVGYPTSEHLTAIDKHGITDFHRKTFTPIRNFIEFGQVYPQLKLAI